MERFWAKVDKSAGPDACWRWTGGTFNHGYAQFWFEGRNVLAHRFAYELCIGPIPDGATIDHVRARGCRFTDCVNPAHLEPVTMRENLLRGDTFQAANAAKTHCIHGHEFTPENTKHYRNRTTTARECITCRKGINQRSNIRKREQRRLARTV